MEAKELIINGMRYGKVSVYREYGDKAKYVRTSESIWFAMKNGIEIKIPMYMLIDMYESNDGKLIVNLHDLLQIEETESEG